MKNYFVYIIRNHKKILYTGITKDLNRRVIEHNKGEGAKFTRGRGPWQLAYSEGPMKHSDALKREINLKRDRSLKSLLKLQKTVNHAPIDHL